MTPLEKFLRDVHEIHSSHAGVEQTSYYGSLETLLNEIGRGLKPRVRCIIHIRNRGAGLPDGGLFTAEQFDRRASHEPKRGQLPVAWLDRGRRGRETMLRKLRSASK